MPTARQHASLDTDVLGVEGDAEDPTASARLAGMLQRLQALRHSAGTPSTVAPAADRPAPQPSAPTPIAIATATRADGLFCDKGTASAEGFRPWYWSYEDQTDRSAGPAELPLALASRTAAKR